MTPREANVILALSGQVDGRKPDKQTAITWAKALDGLRLTDCTAAVEAHQRESVGVWLEPGIIRARVNRVRNDRVERHKWKLSPPDSISEMEDGPEHTLAHSRWYAAEIEAIANGDIPPEPRALTTGTGYAAAIRAALTPPPAEPSDQGDNTEEQVS